MSNVQVMWRTVRNPHLRWAINQYQRQKCVGASTERSMCTTSSSAGSSNTVDKDEVKKFSEISQTWWNEGGEFKALHTMNKLRVPLIRDGLVKQRDQASPHSSASGLLDGLRILDVGCGGGILSEPLARLGAQVTGIDASEENIKMAKWHARLDSIVKHNTRYLAKPVEGIVEEEKNSYDAVVASEIIEHVSDPTSFLSACCALVKPNGSIFVTTLNRTLRSWALAVVAAERVLSLVPAGAHDWNKFITPEQLEIMLQHNNFQTRLVHGMLLNPLTMEWTWISDTAMNYAVHAIKVT